MGAEKVQNLKDSGDKHRQKKRTEVCLWSSVIRKCNFGRMVL